MKVHHGNAVLVQAALLLCQLQPQSEYEEECYEVYEGYTQYTYKLLNVAMHTSCKFGSLQRPLGSYNRDSNFVAVFREI